MPLFRSSFLVALAFVPSVAWAQGNPVGPEFRINTYTTGNQGGSSVATDLSGDFTVVWASFDQDPSFFGVFGQRYTASGTPQGAEFRVNTYTTSSQGTPSVAVEPSGNFVVVWGSYEQDGSDFGVFGQRYAGSGTSLGPEFRVNTHTTSSQYGPSVATDSAGNFVVVWSSDLQDGSGFGVFGQRYASSGTAVGPEFQVNTYATANQAAPSVATDSAGNFVVVWTGNLQDGSGFGVFGQRYASSGTPVGPEFRVNTYTTGDQSGAAVAVDPSGNFVVVWDSGSFPSRNVFGQRFASSGTSLGPEFRVNTTTGQPRFRSSVATDPAGNFAVVWQSAGQDGSNYAVIGQRYADSGIPLGSEFRVNTTTANGQRSPSIAVDSFGRFVVVWSDDLQDGSSGGVFGQRYNMIVPVQLMHFRVE